MSRLSMTLCALGAGALWAALAGVPGRAPAPAAAPAAGTTGLAGDRGTALGAPPAGSPTHTVEASAAAAALAGLRDGRRDCKPGGPWGAELQARGLRPDGALLLDVVLRPHLAHGGLRWWLELPPGTRVLEGAAEGFADPAPGELHRAPLTLALPPGLDAGSVSLAVQDVAGGRASAREVDFGTPPAVGAPERFVADTGAELARLVLPASTRPGR